MARAALFPSVPVARPPIPGADNTRTSAIRRAGSTLDGAGRPAVACERSGWTAVSDVTTVTARRRQTAAALERFERRVAIVAENAGLDRGRLLDWILAWAGLSAAFHIEDGESPLGAMAIAELAAARR